MRYLLPLFIFVAINANAQTSAPPPVTPKPGQVLVSGTVADETTKAGILSRLRDLYGYDQVVDQISVGSVGVPPNWNTHVQKLITTDLKLISHGQLKVDGSNVSVRGEVNNEAQRQQIASNISTSLNPTYIVNNGLRVSTSEQGILDATLANRTIEFESGKASLTDKGQRILDEMSVPLLKFKSRRLEVIGHTDSEGLRASNLALSQARADTVKAYLSRKGVNPDLVSTSGQGPDRPIATNDTVEGRSRNRRIEFRIGQ
ncbi:MAG: OmpA family protein [Burkholderiales bacterium]|nr:OmpA family protein [Burkholderiales bacterium]